MFGGLLYLSKLLEAALAEESSWSELLPYSILHGLGILESLLLPLPKAMDEFCRRSSSDDYESILVILVGLLHTKGEK